MRTRGMILLLLGFLVSSCGWSVRSLRWNTPDDLTLDYEFETEHRLRTLFEKLPAGPTADQVTAMESELVDVVFSLSGTLEKFKAQYFVDRTSGVVVRLAAVEGRQETPEGPVDIDVDGLVGKSVAMRTFDSGEVFEAVGYEHFAGYGRYGELFAELFPQLMVRLPTELPDVGVPARVRTTFPLRIDGFSEAHQTWEVAWTRTTEPEPCLIGKACVQLTYSGTIHERALGRDPSHVTRVTGEGTVEGELLFSLDRNDLQEHSYTIDLERTIQTFEGPFDPRKGEEGEVRAELKQRDQSRTVIRRSL